MQVSIRRKWFSKQQISYYMAVSATSSLLALLVDNTQSYYQANKQLVALTAM